MATFLANAAGTIVPVHISFNELWAHYERAGFLYEAKRERLSPLTSIIRTSWPRLLAASDDVIRIIVARNGDEVRSSHAAFRDTECSFVVHHATSENYALGFQRCQVGQLARIDDTPGITFVGSFFRPDNRWASRLVKEICNAVGPEHWTIRHQAFLLAYSGNVPHSSKQQQVILAAGSQLAACGQFIAEVAGPLRAASLGLAPDDPAELRLAGRYAEAGVKHDRRIWFVERGGLVQAVAIRRLTDVPLNFSLLDRRAEILIHPHTPDRMTLVRDLAETIIADATIRGEPIFPLLIDPYDAKAACAVGFEDTGTTYTDVLWHSTGVMGLAVGALRTMYARFDKHERRQVGESLTGNAIP